MFKYSFALALGWSLIILALVGIPGTKLPQATDWLELFHPDKLMHIALFAPFSFLWAINILQKSNSIKKSIIISSVFGTFYAILTELMQLYVFIGRSANAPDAIADIIGVLFGLVVFYYYSIKKYLKINKNA